MSANKPAIAELVAYGVPQTQIAEAFGVTPQHINNLVRDDEEMKELIQEKATDIVVREHNNKVTEEVIEKNLLQKISSQIDLSDSLIESVKALQLMKDIQNKNRLAGHGAAAELPTSITLNMGDATEVVIQRTGNNEIISIAGRDMAPMPAKKVISMAREAEEQRDERARTIEGSYNENPREISTDSL